jgi:uncharacterized protein
MATTAMERARDFLGQTRIALVGLEREEKGFSRAVFRELLRRGYDVVPVNPALAEVEGRRCFARVQEIVPPIEGALLMTPPSRSAAVVRDCVAAGIRRIWLHRGGGQGAASPEAIDLCRANSIEPVTDLCPFMALPDAGWFHRVHGWFRQAALARARPS